MKTYEVGQGEILIADAVQKADTFWTRFRGLMLRKAMKAGEGLLLMNCPAIHCCFMRFPIDVVYLDEHWKVLGVETVRPWKIGQFYRDCLHVLELEEGKGRPIQTGMKLTFKESEVG